MTTVAAGGLVTDRDVAGVSLRLQPDCHPHGGSKRVLAARRGHPSQQERAAHGVHTAKAVTGGKPIVALMTPEVDRRRAT
jgi:hypothetical protein